MLFILKIAVTPLLVAAVSLAARRWGPTVGGLVMGLPWFTGPVLLVLVCCLLVSKGIWQWMWARTPPVAAGFGYAVILTASMVLAPEQGQSFIYFTF